MPFCKAAFRSTAVQPQASAFQLLLQVNFHSPLGARHRRIRTTTSHWYSVFRVVSGLRAEFNGICCDLLQQSETQLSYNYQDLTRQFRRSRLILIYIYIYFVEGTHWGRPRIYQRAQNGTGHVSASELLLIFFSKGPKISAALELCSKQRSCVLVLVLVTATSFKSIFLHQFSLTMPL